VNHLKPGRRARRLLLRFPFALSLLLAGCGTSLVVAEQKKGLEPNDGGSPPDAEPPSIDAPDALPEVVTICGNARCTNRTANIAGAEIFGFACCVNPQLSQCGIVAFGTLCLEVDKVGKLDSNCSMPQASPLGPLPGCCRPEGKCGVFEPNLGCFALPLWTDLTACKYE